MLRRAGLLDNRVRTAPLPAAIEGRTRVSAEKSRGWFPRKKMGSRLQVIPCRVCYGPGTMSLTVMCTSACCWSTSSPLVPRIRSLNGERSTNHADLSVGMRDHDMDCADSSASSKSRKCHDRLCRKNSSDRIQNLAGAIPVMRFD